MLCTLILAYQFVLLAYVIFQYVPRPPDPIRPAITVVNRIVEPVLTPIDRMLPPLQIGGVGLRLGILVLFLLTSILASAFC